MEPVTDEAPARPIHLFEAFGVELEYMIVRDNELAVAPIVDQVLRRAAGTNEFVGDYANGPIGWSNELMLHVMELKTVEPAETFIGLGDLFAREVKKINELLKLWRCRLMPAAMHPFMIPSCDAKLWPHDNGDIYQAFHRIFDCRGHGWSNLQSTHLNLPFEGDDEFGRLHAAIRFILPILPALAASSPIMEGYLSDSLDSRLDVYRHNSRMVPSIAGRVIPEAVFSEQEYRDVILARIYADVAPHDPEGMLRHEWLNSRGAIARFERNAIEIRVLDVQESPRADIAICSLVTALLEAILEERWCSVDKLKEWAVEPLEAIFISAVKGADTTIIKDTNYLAALGIKSWGYSMNDLWERLTARLLRSPPLKTGDALRVANPEIQKILNEGTLARRMLRSLDHDLTTDNLYDLSRRLCECLNLNRMLHED